MSEYKDIVVLEESLVDASGRERVHILNLLSEAYCHFAPWKTKEYAEEALFLAREIGDGKGVARGLRMVASAQEFGGEYRKALDNLAEAENWARREDDLWETGEILRMKGIVLWRLEEFGPSIEILLRAVGLFEKLMDRRGLANVYNVIGLVYTDLSAFSKAMEFFWLAMTLVDQEEDLRIRGYLYNNIGYLYKNMEEWEKALEYYQRSWEMKSRLSDEERGRSNTLHNMGEVYMGQGRYEEALEVFYRALVLREKTGNRSGVVSTKNLLGETYLHQGKYDEALRVVNEAYRDVSGMDKPLRMAETLRIKGEVYRGMGQLDLAVACLRQGREIALHFEDKRLERDINKLLAETFAEKGCYQEAFAFLEKYVQAKEALLNEKNSKQIVEMEFIYESNKKERKIQQQQIMLSNMEEGNRAKNEFLALISHEFRTPINGIMGMTEFLLRSRVTEEQREQVKIIRSSAETLLGMINNILDFSMIEAGKMVLQRKAFDFTALLAETVYCLKLAAQQKGLYLRLLHSSAEGIPVWGDENRIRQVIVNLLNNAVKFTDQGGITVKFLIENLSDEKVAIRTEVIDTGKGIPADKIYRLFTPFSPMEPSATRKAGGTGLGLAISRQLARLMGGDIKVESDPEKGSVFSFSLVLDRAAEMKMTSLAVETGWEPNPLFAGIRVLVVDDNPINRKVTLGMLQHAGVQAIAVNDGHQALKMLVQERFDLVLMDIQMPDMDGYETTRRVRSGRDGIRWREVPIIAMTACVLPGDRENCINQGMDDYVPKPVKANELFAAMERVIRGAEKKAAQDLYFHESGTKTALDEEAGAGKKVLDRSFLLNNLGGNRDLVEEILLEFLHEGDKSYQMLCHQVEAGDWEQVQKTAHGMRGTFANVGAARLREIMLVLENAVKKGQLDNLQPLIQKIGDELQIVRQAVENGNEG